MSFIMLNLLLYHRVFSFITVYVPMNLYAFSKAHMKTLLGMNQYNMQKI